MLEIAAQHGLAVVEDAAQSLGAEYRDGQRAGSMGTLGCLSFFPSKNLGGFGDGGMVVTNNQELMERIRILRVQGGKPKYYHKFIGGNFRLDTIQAAILNVKLPYLDRWTSLRQQNAERYSMLFKESGLMEKIGLQLPKALYQESGVKHYHIYNQFVIRVPNRDSLRTFLKENGIGNEVYYPVPFHLQECLRDLGHHEGDFPIAELACKETLGIPIYPELEQHQQDQVVSRVQEFYDQ